jgi:methionyl-tRNA formyltransferase
MKNYKIHFAGSTMFSVKILESLIESGEEVELIISQPAKQAGRGLKLTPTPVSELAMKKNIDLLTPLKLNINSLKNKRKKETILIVAAYGQIISEEILQYYDQLCINIHTSILPRWRGAAPIQRAIMEGDKNSGVSLMKIVKELDKGPVYIFKETPINLKNSSQLFDELAILGSSLLVSNLSKIYSGILKPQEQNEKQVTYASKLEKNEKMITWNNSVFKIQRKIQGLNFKPGAWTFFNGKKIKIISSEIAKENIFSKLEPGKIVDLSKDGAHVNCLDGNLLIKELQNPSGKIVLAYDFFRSILKNKKMKQFLE